MVLKKERTGCTGLLLKSAACCGHKLKVIMNYPSVMKNGNDSGLDELLIFANNRCAEENIICLPFLGGIGRIGKGSGNLIDTCAVVPKGIFLTVCIKNLDLIKSLNINTAVSAILTGLVGHIRDLELNVNMSIAELVI